jgi:hypothetical protein
MAGTTFKSRRIIDALKAELSQEIQSIGIISASFPNFQQYPEPRQAGVWPPGTAHDGPNFVRFCPAIAI